MHPAPAAEEFPMINHLVYDDQGRLLIDVRGPRVSAAMTATVLLTALVVRGPIGTGLVAWQWAAFATSTLFGLAWSPYGNVFRAVKRRFDLGPPPAIELEAGPRFAQACGFAVTTVALAGFALGAPLVGWIAVGVVLALSLLLATTGLCIGCELYVIGQRVRDRARQLTAAGGSPDGSPGGSRAHEPGGPARTFDDHDLDALGLDLTDAAAGAVLLGSPTCSRCPQVEQVLAEAADRTDGFRWVRVDTGEHLDLARRLKVIRVPTVLVISPAGELLARTSDVPSVSEVLAAVERSVGDARGHLEGAAPAVSN